MRAGVEALAVVAPDWLAIVVDVPGWGRRHNTHIGFWRLPTSPAKRAELVAAYGADVRLLWRAVHEAGAPAWLCELPAVEVLRVMLVQNYVVTEHIGHPSRIATNETIPAIACAWVATRQLGPAAPAGYKILPASPDSSQLRAVVSALTR